MKRLVLALAVVLTAVLAMVGVALARNQLPESERVVMDAVYMVFPPGYEGFSVELDAGALSMSVQLVGEGPTRPVHFGLMGYRGSDDAATIALDLSASNPTQVVTRQLAGGLYNVIMENRWPVSPNAGLATTSNYAQRVRVRMAYASTDPATDRPQVATQRTTASPSVEEKAAAIKAELVAFFTAYNGALPEDWAPEIRENGFRGPPYNTTGRYLGSMAEAARDYPMVGYYLRYLAPALKNLDTPLEERFLEHFSQTMATTGLPPVFPALTDEEIADKENAFTNPLTTVNFASYTEPDWPYSWAGSWMLGVAPPMRIKRDKLRNEWRDDIRTATQRPLFP